ncbi:response regulator, partial [bacterium]|nr:response regulator [bacterium]
FDPGKKANIFKEYEQDETSHKTAEGTGLGLAICKRIIELMDGEIDCESHAGFGSRFWVEAPLKVLSWEQIESFDAAKPDSVPQFKLDHPVFIVDDVVTNRQLAQNQLNRLGLQCESFSSGEDALKRIETQTFSFALIDCSMPGMDGFELTKQIRNHEQQHQTNRMPIIAMTAHVVSGIRERCHEAGMDDYVSKPISLFDLAPIILKWFPGAAIESALADNHLNSSGEMQQQQENPSIDYPALQEHTDLPADDLKQYLVTACVELNRITKDIQQAILNEDRVQFGEAAHSLKGIAVSIRAVNLIPVITALNENSSRISWRDAKLQHDEMVSLIQKIIDSVDQM